MGLKGKYVGDGLPLCKDLPPYHLLRKGATYRLLGSVSTPSRLRESGSWATNPSIRRLRLTSSSPLYEKFCQESEGACAFSSKVVLNENINCTGAECDVLAPRVIEVELVSATSIVGLLVRNKLFTKTPN